MELNLYLLVERFYLVEKWTIDNLNWEYWCWMRRNINECRTICMVGRMNWDWYAVGGWYYRSVPSLGLRYSSPGALVCSAYSPGPISGDRGWSKIIFMRLIAGEIFDLRGGLMRDYACVRAGKSPIGLKSPPERPVCIGAAYVWVKLSTAFSVVSVRQ